MRDNYDAEKYELRDLLIGFIMLFIGGFLLLRNMTVSSFGFSNWFGSATGGIMIMVFVACFMVAIIRPNFITKWLVVLSIVAIIINVILGTRIHFQRLTMVELLVMVMMFFGGLAFILKVLFVPRGLNRKKSSKNKEAYDSGDDVRNTADRIEKELEELKKRTGK